MAFSFSRGVCIEWIFHLLKPESTTPAKASSTLPTLSIISYTFPGTSCSDSLHLYSSRTRSRILVRATRAGSYRLLVASASTCSTDATSTPPFVHFAVANAAHLASFQPTPSAKLLRKPNSWPYHCRICRKSALLSLASAFSATPPPPATIFVPGLRAPSALSPTRFKKAGHLLAQLNGLLLSLDRQVFDLLQTPFHDLANRPWGCHPTRRAIVRIRHTRLHWPTIRQCGCIAAGWGHLENP